MKNAQVYGLNINGLALPFLFFAFSAQSAVNLSVKDDWQILMGGFIEFDAFHDSTRSLTEVAGSAPIDRGGSIVSDNGRTLFSLRNSRLSFSVLPPLSGGWKTKGYFELDFLGYNPAPGTAAPVNSESSFSTSPTPRMRHGYLSAEKEGLLLLAGQTWTLFGWAPLYVMGTVSVPTVPGELYERNTQFTAIKTWPVGEQKQLQSGLSFTRPLQRDAEIPGVDAGIRMSFGNRRAGYTAASGDEKAESMSIALSGTAREFSTPRAGQTGSPVHVLGSAFAVNGMIPILKSETDTDPSNSMSLSGEFTRGRGFGDQFPGWSGNIPQLSTPGAGSTTVPNLDAGQGGYDANGSFQLVRLQSWNLQVQYHLPTDYHSFATLGCGQVSSPQIGTFTPAKVAYDRAQVSFLNYFYNFTSQIRTGVELAHFTTHYVDGNLAQDNRFQVSTWFRF